MGASNKKNNFCEQVLLTKARFEYYRNNPADVYPTRVYQKLVNKRIKEKQFFYETDLFLIDLIEIENLLKANACPEIIDIEREISQLEEDRDNLYINDYIENENETLTLDEN